LKDGRPGIDARDVFEAARQRLQQLRLLADEPRKMRGFSIAGERDSTANASASGVRARSGGLQDESRAKTRAEVAVELPMAPPRLRVLLALLAVLASTRTLDAQRIEALGPQVRKSVSVSAPKVILEHVEIIDGTGAAPMPDRNLVLENGRMRRSRRALTWRRLMERRSST
jgi:hypothetical protein